MGSTSEERIAKALELALRFGGIDGDHHRAWLIDQMVRALLDCPMGHDGSTGESEAYRAWVIEAKAGAYGPDSYDWNEGIAP